MSLTPKGKIVWDPVTRLREFLPPLELDEKTGMLVDPRTYKPDQPRVKPLSWNERPALRLHPTLPYPRPWELRGQGPPPRDLPPVPRMPLLPPRGSPQHYGQEQSTGPWDRSSMQHTPLLPPRDSFQHHGQGPPQYQRPGRERLRECYPILPGQIFIEEDRRGVRVFEPYDGPLGFGVYVDDVAEEGVINFHPCL